MTQQIIDFPRVYIYNEGISSDSPYGYFGNFPIFDIERSFEKIKCRSRIVEFQDVCFGPYVDYNQLKGVKVRSVDDFFTVYNPGDKKIAIYDRNIFDNEPKKIDWFNRNSIKQDPIIFQFQFTLHATPRNVNSPECIKIPEQTLLETTLFKTMAQMGFDGIPTHHTGNRFFAPSLRPELDTGFLIKTGKTSFSWYRADSVNMNFEVMYIYNRELQGVYSIQNSARLIKCLQEDRAKRNEYFKQQYSK